MGTRFIASHESIAPEGYKQMLVDSDIDDLVVSASITGTPASWLKPSLHAAGVDLENMPATPERNYDGNRALTARRWVDTWSAGQGIGAIRQISSIAEIVTALEYDYQSASDRFSSLKNTFISATES